MVTVGREVKRVSVTYNLYADVIFFNNFTMDFILLSILRKIMRLEKRRGGILMASVFGAAYALAVTVYPFSGALLQAVFTYGFAGAAMTWMAFPKGDIKTLLKTVAGLYLTAFMMAGFLNLLQRAGGKSIPFQVFFPAAGGCFFLICFLWETVKAAGTENGHLYSVVIFYKGRSEKLTAFMDTGNRLKEPFSHKPVSVVSADSCKELFQTVTSVMYIPYRSVGKREGVLPAVKADRMEIEQQGRTVTVESPFIAISRETLSPDGAYQMLLNEKIW